MEPFLQEEVRCGHTVSAEMKRVWAVQLDLLAQFSQVCEKHGLCYFLDGGTLLGAVRHSGFIPWDNDVDVIMPRADYDILCGIAPKVFQHPYFFQTALTEPGLFRTHAQLRNSTTTGYISADKDLPINKGIFLDIFILDGLPASPALLRLHKQAVCLGRKFLWLAYNADYSHHSFFKRICLRMLHFLLSPIPFSSFFRFYDKKILAAYSRNHPKTVGDLTLGWHENVFWDAAWFSDYRYMTFEHLSLRVPIGYDAVLRRQYGNYQEIPSLEQRGQNQHGEVFLDPDRPYTFYFPAKETR